MNERIKEIETQAWDYAYDHETVKGKVAFDGFINANFSDKFSKKFAELIVWECFYCVEILEKIAHASNADIPPNYDKHTYLKTLETVKVLMKVHFGVEK